MSSIPETNLLEFLRDTPLSRLSYDQRCALKTKRPTPQLTINVSNKGHMRTFQMSWYVKYPWLTGCSNRNKMFCYVCIMFGAEDPEWCSDGIWELANFIRKANKHQESRHHLLHSESFHMLGKVRIKHFNLEAARLQALKHNEEVTLNRQFVKRLIQAICFLSKQELAFRDHKENLNSINKGNYLELLDLLAQSESLVREHLQFSSKLQGTSPQIQNELIEILTQVLNGKIKSEIDECEFVSLQANDTLTVSCKNQLSLIFRYCIKDRVEERFVGFYDVSNNKAGRSLSAVIHKVLNEWGVDINKVISQAYDGSAIISSTEGGIQKLVKECCPNALFIHYYAHHLNLVLLHGCKGIKQVRVFVCSLTAFHSFFSKFSKRMVLLTEKGFKLPLSSGRHWNFHSRAVSTILKYFTELHGLFTSIIEDEDYLWDDDSVNCAVSLKRNMDDPAYVYLLCVFEACFVYVDPLFELLQSSIASITTCSNEINTAIENIGKLKNDAFTKTCIKNCFELNRTLTFSETQRISMKVLTYKIIDCLLVQMKSRFQDFPHLQFMELVNGINFKEYNISFPQAKVTGLKKLYPFFNAEQLKNELCNIYADENKYLSPQNLLKYLTVYGLDSLYVEVVKLLRLVLTLPVTAAGSVGTCTLKRINTHLKNCMSDNRLSCLSSLAVEKKLLSELSSDNSFLENVVDTFAEKKNRQVQLRYTTPFKDLVAHMNLQNAI